MKKTILLMIFYCTVQTLFAQKNVNNTTEINNKSDILQKSSSTNTVVTYDFTTSASKYFGGAVGATILEINGADTTWGMVAGDANGDGQITSLDFDLWLPKARATETGYQATDLNLDGQNTSLDFDLWLPNARAAKSSQVPN